MAIVRAWMSGVVNTTKTTGVYEGVQQLNVMDYVLSAPETTASNYAVDGEGRPVVALASAARTATNSSNELFVRGARGVVATLTATALAATPSITFSIEGYDSTSDTWTAILTSAAINTAAPTSSTLTVASGIAETANVSASTVLPDRIRITVTHSDSDSITYSVGLAWIS